MNSLADQVLHLWTTERGVHSRGRNAVRGIACTSDTQVIQKFLDLSLTEPAATLSHVDRIILLHTFMRGSHVSVVQSLEFILANFDAILRLVHPMDELFEGIHRHVRTAQVSELLGRCERSEGGPRVCSCNIVVRHKNGIGKALTSK